MRLLMSIGLTAALAGFAGCGGDAGTVDVGRTVDPDVRYEVCRHCKVELPYTKICTTCHLCVKCDECFKKCTECFGEVPGARICPKDGRCDRCDLCDK